MYTKILSEKCNWGIKVWALSYLEAKNDGPNKTKSKARISIDNIMWAKILEMDMLVSQELQGLIHILQTMDSHLPPGGTRLEGNRQRS